ncbi:hypothetical protein NPIL_588521 [Nephila pilipes]|uniref:Uncharacterized protein n=1 Tax=Nephila pilipes TaxID=299642 RepID=A0A8X6PAK6_NEPPI|nr:hypothetical protein NPIL_130191 [Nephila pilipes]GFT54782.1 hypothetical protein NPIL_54691 [Nephila pilipes]GFU12101.1 hypothetical protein NPIL_588521 [Nephila pilipes]
MNQVPCSLKRDLLWMRVAKGGLFDRGREVKYRLNGVISAMEFVRDLRRSNIFNLDIAFPAHIFEAVLMGGFYFRIVNENRGEAVI